MSYADRLQAAMDRTGNACLVGLDPHLAMLPEEFSRARDASLPRSDRAAAVGDFLCEVIDVVAGRVPAVKPQSAFFELLGADGAREWERVVARARDAGLIVIGDVKRGDIASTATAYARAHLEGDGPNRVGACDAVTLNPLLGADSIEPFLEVCRATDTGAYVLVRTSNPGSADFQRHGEPELSHRIAAAVDRWGSELIGACGLSDLGAVVGATHGDELRDFRARMPRTPLLLPGYGAQGAGASDVVGAFLVPTGPGPRGAIVNSSRGILFAHRQDAWAGRPWRDATSGAVDAMIEDLRAALAASAT